MHPCRNAPCVKKKKVRLVLQKDSRTSKGSCFMFLPAQAGFQSAETLGDKSCSDLRTNPSFQLATGDVDGETLKETREINAMKPVILDVITGKIRWQKQK